MENTNTQNAPTEGKNDGLNRRKRRKVVHQCAVCGAVFDRKGDCWEHLSKAHPKGRTGAEMIADERKRQIDGEGWQPETDAKHISGELNDAAISYATAASRQARGESIEYLRSMVPAGEVRWPWEDCWWKPSQDQIRNLVKAGALIAAEIDRLQRAKREAV